MGTPELAAVATVERRIWLPAAQVGSLRGLARERLILLRRLSRDINSPGSTLPSPWSNQSFRLLQSG